MRWCLQVKLAQNYEKFRQLLLATGDKPIVEHSRRDDFWGAKPVDDATLIGVNALGRLLMELRERARQDTPETLLSVNLPAIEDFRLYGRPIEPIDHLSVNAGTLSIDFDSTGLATAQSAGQLELLPA